MSLFDIFNNLLNPANTQQVVTTVGQVAGQITETVGQSINLISNLVASLAGKRAVSAVNVQQTIDQALTFLQNFKPQLTTQLATILGNYNSQVQTFLSSLNKPQARSVLLAASQQAKGEIADAFNSLLNEALGHLTSIATTLANVGLASVLTGLQGGKRGIFDGLGLGDLLNNLTSTLSGHIDNITSSVVSVGQNLLGVVTPHLQDLQDQLTNHALNAAQSLLGTLGNISGSLQG